MFNVVFRTPSRAGASKLARSFFDSDSDSDDSGKEAGLVFIVFYESYFRPFQKRKCLRRMLEKQPRCLRLWFKARSRTFSYRMSKNPPVFCHEVPPIRRQPQPSLPCNASRKDCSTMTSLTTIFPCSDLSHGMLEVFVPISFFRVRREN